MAGYLKDIVDTYIVGPWQQKGAIVQKAAGVPAAIANVFFRGGDEVLRWFSGQEYQAPQGILGNTRRDIGNLLGNLLPNNFHPLKAASNLWSIVSGDIPADIKDALLGFRSRARAALAGV